MHLLANEGHARREMRSALTPSAPIAAHGHSMRSVGRDARWVHRAHDKVPAGAAPGTSPANGSAGPPPAPVWLGFERCCAAPPAHAPNLIAPPTAAVRTGGVTRLALRSGRAAGGPPRHIRAEPGSPALCSARVPVFPMRALIYSECSYPCHARAHVRARVQACIAVHVCVRARVRVLATFIAADRDAEPRDWQALGAVCGESAGFAAAGGTD